MRSAIVGTSIGSSVAGSVVVALLLAGSPTSSAAQTVIITNRPVVRHVIEEPRVLVVARIELGGRGHGDGYRRVDDRGWRRSGYRPVTLYYVDGRYYDRWDDRYRGRDVRRVVVYQRGGRYYRDWDDRYDRNDRNDRGRGRGNSESHRNDRKH